MKRNERMQFQQRLHYQSKEVSSHLEFRFGMKPTRRVKATLAHCTPRAFEWRHPVAVSVVQSASDTKTSTMGGELED